MGTVLTRRSALQDVYKRQAYGWPVDLSDDEVLRRLLALNRERTS